jgi:hypothetical protein
MLGDIERNNGNRTGANAKYRAVVDIDSTNLFALNNLAYILALGKPDAALRYGQQAGEIAPDNATVQDPLRWVYWLGSLSDRSSISRERCVGRLQIRWANLEMHVLLMRPAQVYTRIVRMKHVGAFLDWFSLF